MIKSQVISPLKSLKENVSSLNMNMWGAIVLKHEQVLRMRGSTGVLGPPAHRIAPLCAWEFC